MNRLAFAILLFAACCVQRHAAAHPSIELQLRQLDREISAAPERAELFQRRAEIFRRHRQFREALQDLDTADRLSHGSADLAFARAMLYHDLARDEDALRLVQSHIACGRAGAEAYLLAARIQRAMGRFEDSSAQYQQALRLSARPSPDDYLELASLQRSTGAGEAALQTIDGGMSSLGPIVSLQLAAIDVEIESGRFDAALIRIDRLKRAGLPEESVLVKQAQVLSLAGRGREAEETRALAKQAILAQIRNRGATPASQMLLKELDSLQAAALERRP